ncbi:MAG: hypothetical protein ACKOAD_06905 [Gammaproteobacteria bacterium]
MAGVFDTVKTWLDKEFAKTNSPMDFKSFEENLLKPTLETLINGLIGVSLQLSIPMPKLPDIETLGGNLIFDRLDPNLNPEFKALVRKHYHLSIEQLNKLYNATMGLLKSRELELKQHIQWWSKNASTMGNEEEPIDLMLDKHLLDLNIKTQKSLLNAIKTTLHEYGEF